jgi:LuxR family maltose regulon positive regulatory protein
VHHAYINQWVGLREQVELWLRYAEQAAAGEPQDARLTGHIAARRAHWALVTGDVNGVVEQAQKALTNLPTTDHWRMTTLVALGGAYWAQGDVHQSEATFAQASTGARQLGDRSVAVLAACYAGLQQEKQGRLKTARHTYEEALAISERRGGQNIVSVGFPLIRLANLWREWNDLAQAQMYLEEGVAVCVAMGQADVLTDAYIVQARLHLALDQPELALAALQQAQQVMASTAVDPWLGCWLDECYLRYWLGTGAWETAVHWGQTSGLTVDGPLSYHHDLHHRNLARLLLAQGQREPDGPYLAQALALLDRLLASAEQAGWAQEAIQILILQALAHQAAVQPEAACHVLAQAVALAEPGGYVRLFVDEGPALAELLGQLVDGPTGAYVAKLLAALADEGGETAVAPRPQLTPPRIDSLSKRELDVLRLLPTHLSSTEMAEELFVAPSTIRSHIKSIYSKLNVHSRADAVARAEALHLL